MSGSFGFVSSPSTKCKSVRQTAHAATFTKTCIASGLGTGKSTSRNGRRCASRSIARMNQKKPL
jgi:hypothetical protein